MLTLTDNASAIVNQISTEQIPGEHAGLRITADDTGEQPGFEIAAAQEAEPGDQVVEQSGATVYLDQSAAALLDDKVLDASVDATGKVAFVLAPQG